MDSMSAIPRLRERSAGVQAIDALLNRLRAGAGGALFVTGDAGLGKTTLLDLAAAKVDPTALVARARGQAMEVDLPFGLAAQGLEPIGGAHLCPPVESAAEPAESRVAVWVRARAWLEATADTSPVLVLLDDLHWSDPDSLELLAFLARRVQDIPVGIVAALRPWPPAARELMERLVAEGAAATVGLVPLSREGSHQMLMELVGDGTAHGHPKPSGAEFEKQAWMLAGGNPFLIERLANLALVEGVLPEPEGLNLGEFRKILLLSAFAALPPVAIDYARAASVLGSEFRMALVSSVAGLDHEQADSGFEVLFGNGLLTETRRGWAAFAHPLVARAVYEDLSPARRTHLHARAFDRLAGLGEMSLAAHHAVSADLVGDPVAVEAVTRAAEESLAAGAVLRAVEHLRSAVELSAGAVPGPLWLRLGEALLAAAEPQAATECCRSAIASADLTASSRVHGLRLLARALAYAGDMPASARAAADALAHARQAAPEAEESVVVEQVHALWQTAGPGPAAVLIETLCRGVEPRDPVLRATRAFVNHYAGADGGALDELAGIVGESGEPATSDRTGAAHRGDGRTDQDSPFDPMLLYLSVARLSEAFDAEERVAVRARARATLQGLLHAQAALGISKVDSLLRQGRLGEATQVLDEVERYAEVVPLMSETISLCRATLACEVGELDRAREMLTAAGPAHYMWMSRVWAAHLNSLILLEREHIEAASAGYLELETMVTELGVADPCAVPWASSAIRAHLRSGRVDDAERVCARTESASVGLSASWPRLAVLAGRAGVAAARDDRRTAQRLFTEAAQLPVPLPLYRARVLLDFGAWLRRTNQPLLARPYLAETLAIAEHTGALGLGERAAAELRVAGGRRRARSETTEQLTAQETRVAELASQGLTNTEIARHLSLSVKTIETHLTRIYRKLAVGSKRDLRHRLAPEGSGNTSFNAPR